nr:MAG TPA: hypothetical protein [Caudoviricetes sp.]
MPFCMIAFLYTCKAQALIVSHNTKEYNLISHNTN